MSRGLLCVHCLPQSSLYKLARHNIRRETRKCQRGVCKVRIEASKLQAVPPENYRTTIERKRLRNPS